MLKNFRKYQRAFLLVDQDIIVSSVSKLKSGRSSTPCHEIVGSNTNSQTWFCEGRKKVGEYEFN